MLFIPLLSIAQNNEIYQEAPTKEEISNAVQYCQKTRQNGVHFWTENNIYCLYDDITRSYLGIFNAYEITENSIIVLNSGGGFSTQALQIANILLDKNVTVVVKDQCRSACANYIFLAGKFKFVYPGAIIGWHGGFNNFVPAGTPDGLANEVKAGWEAQKNFFRKISVDENMVRFPPLTLAMNPTVDKYGKRKDNVFWSFTSEELKCFGVKGLLNNFPFIGRKIQSQDCSSLARPALDQERWIGMLTER
jgi:hypothetical protein